MISKINDTKLGEENDIRTVGAFIPLDIEENLSGKKMRDLLDVRSDIVQARLDLGDDRYKKVDITDEYHKKLYINYITKVCDLKPERAEKLFDELVSAIDRSIEDIGLNKSQRGASK